MHRTVVVAALGMALLGTAALADEKVSDAEGKKVQAAIGEWGCSGGKMEKEAEATGVYEVDDAKCKGGQYDIKLDKDFKVLTITRD